METIIVVLTIIIVLLVVLIIKLHNSNDNLRGMINYATKEDERNHNKISELELENEHLYKELKNVSRCCRKIKENCRKNCKKRTC